MSSSYTSSSNINSIPWDAPWPITKSTKTYHAKNNSQVGIKLRELVRLLDKKFKLSLENKILIYKAILKPVWIYESQLWNVTAQSNIDIKQRFQSNVLRLVTNAPWYVRNDQIHSDLSIKTVLKAPAICHAHYVTQTTCKSST